MSNRAFCAMQVRATLVLFATVWMTTSAIAQNNFPITGDVTIGTKTGVAPLTVSSGAGGATASFSATGGGGMAVEAISRASDSGGSTSGYALYAAAPYDGSNASGGTYAFRSFGLYVDNLYSYYGENALGYTYGVFAAGGADNYFAGNVGVGVTLPQAPLHVSATTTTLNWLGILNNTNNSSGTGYGVGLRLQNSNMTTNLNEANKWAGLAAVASSGGYSNNTDLAFYTGNYNSSSNATSAPSERVRIQSTTGNVGIGTTAPGAPLEVNGSGIKLTANSGGSITFADGTIQSTAWNGVLAGGDYAESVSVSGDRSRYEPGDIIVIDATQHGKFAKSYQPYSTLVAGIYSTKPGLLGRRQSGGLKTSTTEIPMAMVGIVPTKVSAENGPIKDGDLLVTSSTAGLAMKGTDPSRMMGAVIGKAMDSLESGNGVIEVLVRLQ